MALYCSKKTIVIIKKNNVKTPQWFYFLNCLHSSATENKRKSRKKVCENKDFCSVEMTSEGTKISEFNQYQNSDKAPFTIYADLEFLIEKIGRCKRNPENWSTT